MLSLLQTLSSSGYAPFAPSFTHSYIHTYTQVIHRKALNKAFLCSIDIFPRSEKLYLGLRGGELCNSYAWLVRGYELRYKQSPQAEALRCTKTKRPGGGVLFCDERRL